MFTNSHEKMLIASDVTKCYGASRVLGPLFLKFEPGQVICLLGGNGAGKSTLLGLLSGYLRPSSGRISFRSEQSIPSIRQAKKLGIGTSFQDGNLVPDWRVSDHFTDIKNGEKPWTWIAPLIKAQSRCSSLILPDQQKISIARAFHDGSRVVLLDEPTAVFSNQERDVIFAKMKAIAEAGVCVIWITHDLVNALRISDRIIVLSHGVVVHDNTPGNITIESLHKLFLSSDNKAGVEMPGFIMEQHKKHSQLVIQHNTGSILLASGKIVGITGNRRYGTHNLMRAAVGLEDKPSARLFFNSLLISSNYASLMREGIVYMSRERMTDWLFDGQSVFFNITLGLLVKRRFYEKINKTDLFDFWRQTAMVFGLNIDSGLELIGSLSGGNCQKAVLARYCAMSPKFMLLDEPFSGVDAPTRFLIFDFFRILVKSGVGILIYSQEHADLVASTDNIYVFDESGYAFSQISTSLRTAYRND